MIKIMFQKFLLRRMLKQQGVPEEQGEKIIKLAENNPELFKKMAEEIKVKTKEGKSQQAAAMEVMQKYQAELKTAWEDGQ